MATRPIVAIVALICLGVVSTVRAQDPAGDPRVKELLDARGLTYKITASGNFQLTLPATDSRTQFVFIQSGTRDFGNFTIREVWSPILKQATPLDADQCNKLLRDNNLDKTGAWQLYESEGTFMVTFCSKVPIDVDAESLESFIFGIVEIADDMEKQVTGTDDF